MSRSNIISQGFTIGGFYVVTFRTRDGERSYRYSPTDGARIATGADPRGFSAEETDDTGGLLQGLAEDAEEAAEGAAEVLPFIA